MLKLQESFQKLSDYSANITPVSAGYAPLGVRCYKLDLVLFI